MTLQGIWTHRHRWGGVFAGCFTQLLFLFTVWRLYWFLAAGDPSPDGESLWTSLAWDAALSLQFAVSHSLLLLPTVRKKLTRRISPAFYGLMFCCATCASLLLTIWLWRGCRNEVWRLQGTVRIVILAGFFSSWVALYYSISVTGLGYQTGYTPWKHWLRGQPVPPRAFAPRGPYLWLRHPVYFAFLGLIWFTPRMSVDHALLTLLWTAYIFVGSWLKDRRLAFYVGERYRAYAAQVPGYPFLQFFPPPFGNETAAGP